MGFSVKNGICCPLSRFSTTPKFTFALQVAGDNTGLSCLPPRSLLLASGCCTVRMKGDLSVVCRRKLQIFGDLDPWAAETHATSQGVPTPRAPAKSQGCGPVVAGGGVVGGSADCWSRTNRMSLEPGKPGFTSQPQHMLAT